MSEPVLRAVVVTAAVLGAGAAVLLVDRSRRRRAERLDLDLDGLPGGVLFFTEDTCTRCDAVRRMLQDMGIAHTEVRHGASDFEAIGVDAVPLVVVRDTDGEVTAQIGGVPGKGKLRRALAASE